MSAHNIDYFLLFDCVINAMWILERRIQNGGKPKRKFDRLFNFKGSESFVVGDVVYRQLREYRDFLKIGRPLNYRNR